MKRLSAKSTVIYKFGLPAGMFVLDFVALWFLETYGVLGALPRLPLVIAMIVPSVMIFWMSWTLKFVAVDGTSLVVSDYFREARIPVS